LLTKDNQLHEALNLLKGLHIFREHQLIMLHAALDTDAGETETTEGARPVNTQD